MARIASAIGRLAGRAMACHEAVVVECRSGE